MTHDGDKFELGEFIQVKINKQPMTQEKGTVVAEGGNRKLELTTYLEVDSRRTPEKHQASKGSYWDRRHKNSVNSFTRREPCYELWSALSRKTERTTISRWRPRILPCPLSNFRNSTYIICPRP